MYMEKPIIAVTMGDPAGIGPEIVAKSIADKATFDVARCIVIGDKKVMEKAIEIVGADLKVNVVDSPADGDYSYGVLNMIDLDNIDMSRFEYGKINAMCGQAAFDYIKKSIEITMDKQADAVATTPINKESLHAAEVDFIGHTEIFGALTGTDDPLTMFETNGLRVFFLTRHKSLRDMLDDIKKDRIIDYVERCTDALRRLGVKEGTMAVAGLNPHSGEHGLFGWEEVKEIAPAVEELRREDLMLQDRFLLILYSIRLLKEGLTASYPYIMIRGISLLKHWTLTERFLSLTECQFYVHP